MSSIDTLEGQLEVVSRNIGLATKTLIKWLEDPDGIHQMAVDRAKSGHRVFGARMYTSMGESEVMFEAREELADAIVYLIAAIYHQRESGR